MSERETKVRPYNPILDGFGVMRSSNGVVSPDLKKNPRGLLESLSEEERESLREEVKRLSGHLHRGAFLGRFGGHGAPNTAKAQELPEIAYTPYSAP